MLAFVIVRRLVVALVALGASAICACSFLTSWDDVQIGAGDDGGAAVDGGGTGEGSIGHPVTDGGREGGPFDAGRDAGDGGCTPPGSFYCSDAGTAWFLLRCQDPDSDLEVPVCDGQCIFNQPFGDDSCACTPGKDYCGFHSNGQDPMSLWTCSGANGVFTLKQTCAHDCLVAGRTSSTHPVTLDHDVCE